MTAASTGTRSGADAISSALAADRLGIPDVIYFVMSAAAPLTADGWGGLKIGMREADAVRRFGLKVPPDDGVNSTDCRQLFMRGRSGILVMTEKGRVTRITIFGTSQLKTDRGLGVGASEADVRRAYGAGLKIEPSAYDEEPAHYLTAWTASAGRGVRFETGPNRRVERIHVGDEAIEYVEGCL